MNISFRIPAAVLMAIAIVASSRPAEAHFVWLELQEEDGQSSVQVYFAEIAAPDDPRLLGRLDGMVVHQLSAGSPPRAVRLTRVEDSFSGRISGNAAKSSLFVAAHDCGVVSRGGAEFRLRYYAKTGPAAGHDAWTNVDYSEYLPLDVIPTVDGDLIHLRVRFQGQPLEGAEVKASGPGLPDFTGTTDGDGRTSFTITDRGLYSIRARHVEQTEGEVDGKKYSDVRHYSTVAIEIPSTAEDVETVTDQLPPLPQPVTSFGAAIVDGALYVYGGHTGSAHSYSMAEQGSELRRLALKGGEWETIAEGPPLQGLSLVAHGGKLYRIGGFTAKNAEGEPHDLWSQDSVACFDPKTGEWTDLPPLPEPRSSHDAAVGGDSIYVVGGWTLAGEGETQWHETAWVMDLSQSQPEWKPLPTVPFHRRALAAAAHNGKLYVIGGMQQEGGPTTRVDVFDPATGQWSQGPSLLGEGMTGFGAAAFAAGGSLYASTSDGSLQRLNGDGSAWEVIARTPTARFFHRLLPVDDHRLLVVGGANMQSGKFDEVEILDVR